MSKFLQGVGTPSRDQDSNYEQLPKIRVGICAMDKKATSKPMREIVTRLMSYGEFKVFTFGDKVILEDPIEKWPECDCMLSWHSEGFPLAKAQAYASLRRPFLVNDVFMQDQLLDRRLVYAMLEENSIPVPTHIVVERDGLPEGGDPEGFREEEDYVELNGRKIYKPFVEKPVSGEDHNIHIYYPHSMGGGVKRLFRKVEDKSSSYDPNHPGTVRRKGSFIYEEFLATGGTDVKVYTVGPRYAHAEARKSPVVDGKVLRTPDGKELRFPILLSPQEKEIARMVCLAFGQKVCGFDLLRSEKGKSFVCDVNGWSFVKNSGKYYDDAAGILRSIILSAIAPHRLAETLPPPLPSSKGDLLFDGDTTLELTQLSPQDLEALGKAASLEPGAHALPSFSGSVVGEDEMLRTDDRSQKEELRCVLAVIRHGDRTPKQKLKIRVTQPALLALFEKYKDSKGKQAKMKSPAQLQELLDITRQLLQELGENNDEASTSPTSTPMTDEEKEARTEMRERLRIVKTVLEQGGHFSGINRKVQLKPLKWGPPQGPDGTGPAMLEEGLLILKYGGVLTHAGRQQAEDLGRVFRMVMYPRYGSAGGGLLRLHSTYRHDLKIYSSDEGRVQTSAAAFTKGLLDLEGTSLTPILVSLVQKDASMLDAFGKGASEDIRNAKNILYEAMTWDPEKSTASYVPIHATTPTLLSPPLSPKPMSRSQSMGMWNERSVNQNSEAAYEAATQLLDKMHKPATSIASNLNEMSDAASNASSQYLSAQYGAGEGGDASKQLLGGSGYSSSASLSGMEGRTSHTDLKGAGKDDGELATQKLGTASSNPGDSASSSIPPVHPNTRGQGARSQLKDRIPANPLKLLLSAVDLMRVLVDELRGLTLKEPPSSTQPRFSSLSQDPREIVIDDKLPCSGEKCLLMFDRWKKLLKNFYNPRKHRFDISKVPDIYDSAKYDAIHNAHLPLTTLMPLYEVAKKLANAVVPNEYGIDSVGKLNIGSKICQELLGKLLGDLESMKEESLATIGMELGNCSNTIGGESDAVDTELGKLSLQDDKMVTPRSFTNSGTSNVGLSGSDPMDDVVEEREIMHRLCPTYASDINSPLRHVRTRIYFTSESHIHSLINVLRYSHLNCQSTVSPSNNSSNPGGSGSTAHNSPRAASPCEEASPSNGCLLSLEAEHMLQQTCEYDYLTHVVFRMYENKAVPVENPERFRVEVLFSPGAAYNPFDVSKVLVQPHTLPVQPRRQLHRDDGVSLRELESRLTPYAKSRRFVPACYALQVGLKAPSWRMAMSTRNGEGATSTPQAVVG